MLSLQLTCVTWNRRSLVETSSHADASKSTQSGGRVLHIHVDRGNRFLKLFPNFSNHFPLAHWSKWFWWCSLKSALCTFPPSLSCVLAITLKAKNPVQTAHNAKQPAAWNIFFNVICELLPATVHCILGRWFRFTWSDTLLYKLSHNLCSCLPDNHLLALSCGLVNEILFFLFPRMSPFLPFSVIQTIIPANLDLFVHCNFLIFNSTAPGRYTINVIECHHVKIKNIWWDKFTWQMSPCSLPPS